MDPQSQFKERYETFIKSRQQQGKTQPINPPKPRHPFNKFYLLGLLLGVCIVLPGLFVFLRSNTPQGTQIPTQPPKNVQETVTEDEIYQELVGMTGENAKKSLSDPTLVTQAKKNILKRRALQKISSTNDASIAESKQAPNYSLSILQTEIALEKAVVSSRTIDYVSTYVAPNETYEKESKTVKENFEYIREQMLQGKTTKQAYDALVIKLGRNPNYNL